MIFEYFLERFGIERSAFDGFGIYTGQKGKVYIGPKNLIPKPEIVSVGILIARTESSIKPSTNFVQIFGHLAKKSIIDVDEKGVKDYVDGLDLRTESELSDGYVIVRYNGFPLGCALKKGDLIINNLPKAKRIKLKYI